jgi:hypothetical protein
MSTERLLIEDFTTRLQYWYYILVLGELFVAAQYEIFVAAVKYSVLVHDIDTSARPSSDNELRIGRTPVRAYQRP